MGEGVYSSLVLSEDKNESFCPMFFGVSCAFFALRLLSEPETNDKRWSEISDRLLQGSAHLLGLLIWRVQRVEANSETGEILRKLEKSEREIKELKRRRSEDAKANEKVVSIYAAQKQSWFSERKKLRQQIGALLNEFRVLQTKKDDSISELNDKLKEKEAILKSKDEALEQEVQKREEMEVKLKDSVKVLEELRETVRREAQDHSSELWKHKTAFIELISNQRQLEAEMGRSLKQAEAAKQELDLVLEQKEESVLMAQKLSLELVKMRKDLDQKEKILSAMLRKLKLDTAEKQMLLKEVKLSKAQRKQAGFETERWRAVSETKRERHSLKSMLSRHTSSKFHSNAEVQPNSGRSRSLPNDFILEYDQPEHKKELETCSPFYDQYSHQGNEEMMFKADVKHLEGWVRSEAEKYSTLVEQRHHLEINAFSEQLRVKDEKLEGFRWRLLSMDLESKHLQSHIEGLNHDISQLRQENMKLGSLLLEREAEVNSLKQQFALKLESQSRQETNLIPCSHDQTIWSKVKIIKRIPGEKEEETRTGSIDVSQKIDPQNEEETSSTSLTVQSPEKDFEEEKDVVLDPGSICNLHTSPEKVVIFETSSSGQNLSKKTISPWKVDLHALGVSYKVKRLKQQLLMLERFTGKQKSGECEGDDGANAGVQGFHILMALLNKQISRYQSLQGKIDDLCKRMHENELEVSHGDFSIARTKKETKTLEKYLEETFQLQRYLVASGQKLMELQSKIVSGFVEAVEGLDGPASFDMKRFGDSVATLFKEVQRGLEIRIARIIGDLEGTLACDGIIHLK